MNEQYEHIISEEVSRYFEEIKLKLSYRMSVIFLLVFCVLTYAYYFDSFESFIMMGIGGLVCGTCLLMVHFRRNYNFVFYTCSICGVVLTAYALIFFHETVHLVDTIWMLSAVSLAFFTISNRLGYILLFISLVTIGIFIFYSLNIHIVTVKPRNFYQQLALMTEMLSGFGVNFYLFYLVLDFHRFSRKKLLESNEKLNQQNIQIRIQNDEKTVLVREIHHRVKNNLQIIISLLRMQSLEIDEEKLKNHFEESINRIMVMSLIHSKLYQNDSLSKIKLKDYLSDLTRDLIQINTRANIEYEIRCDVQQIGLKTIIPLGLIFNELISNSLKHAFGDRGNGKIAMDIRENEDWIDIRYEDDGTWLDRPNHQSFGLTLIETLIEQLEGTKKITTAPGQTVYTFRVKNLEDPELPIS